MRGWQMYHARPMLRVALFLAVLLLFLFFNIITCRTLVCIHPRRKKIVVALVIAGNVMWFFFPILNARTDFSRAMRAVFGPPWFAWLCFITVYAALLLPLVIVWIPFRRRRFADFARWPSRIFLWTTIVAGVIGVYTALIPLEVRRVPILLDGLPPELNGIRIALIADLHVGLFSRPSRLRQIFAMTNAISPDLVVLGGDLVDDDPYYVAKLLDATRQLSSPIPIIGVLGNHEMYGQPFEIIRRLQGTRIRLLVNEGTLVIRPSPPLRGSKSGTAGLWIAGLSDYAARDDALKPDFAPALERRPPAAFPIILAHQPRAFPEAERRRLPLTLCAHSHGGQCGFRPLGWSLAGLFLPYHMGLYRRGESQAYVNTGTGYWLMPWRLGVTPEITLIELRRR